MSKEILTHSEVYVKKTNRIILAVGITSFVVFIVGVYLLIKSNTNVEYYEEPVFTADDDALNIDAANPLTNNIEFSTLEDGEIPITTTPDPVSMGQVVLGSEAKNVLTVGTNGKANIRIVSVQLAEPPFVGFSFNDGFTNKVLRGYQTCHITMNWIPVVAGNVQNNFIVSWHESSLGRTNAKAEKVPVEGTAIRKEDCNFCDTGPTTQDTTAKDKKNVRNAIGPNGEVIGQVDEEGYVYDDSGNVIGRVNASGMIVDDQGNVVGIEIMDAKETLSEEFLRTVKRSNSIS